MNGVQGEGQDDQRGDNALGDFGGQVIGDAVGPGAPAVPGVVGEEDDAGQHLADEPEQDGQQDAGEDLPLLVFAEDTGVAQARESHQMLHKNLGPVDRGPQGEEKQSSLYGRICKRENCKSNKLFEKSTK